ncbi:unnamed protein product [Closterium sp. NIES-65]|nr:unnamed protein product [Closterium sp. NIES-65]
MATPSVLTFDAEGRAVDFEGCSPSPLLPSVASAAAADQVGFEVVVGVVAEVEVSVAAVEAEEAEAVAEGAEAAEVAEAVAAAVVLVAALRRGVGPVVVRASSSSEVVKPCPLISFVSGTLRVSAVGVRVPAPTFSAPAIALLSREEVAIFDLYFEAFLAAMYAVADSVEGDCYLCVPPDPGIETAPLGAGEAAALGASASATPGVGESALSGTTPAHALHTLTLDSGASRSFFRDCTTLTPLSRPVAVSMADPFGVPVLACFSTVLPCQEAPSGTLSGLYLPLFSTNLGSGADLQDMGVDQFTPASQRVTHCTCARTGRHLATFTRWPGSSLLSFGTTALVTPLCLVFEAWPPVSLSLVSPVLSLLYLRGLPLPASPTSRGDSVM